MVWDVEEVIADCSHSPSRLQSIWESAPHLISPATSGEMDHTGLPTHPSHPGDVDNEPLASHKPEDEWRRMFNSDHYLEIVKEMGLNGQLRNGIAFRSVCWKIFLGVLPESRTEWKSKTLSDRQRYHRIRQKYLVEPHEKMKAQDNLTVNNPLSLETDSPWNQYFMDDNLRKEIYQDVERTFPEVEFFKDHKIKKMLMDVLFCYSKEHSNLGYRQGMHELLAPIIFVLDSDKRDEDDMKSVGPEAVEMNVIMDPGYIENDSFILLEALMETCEIWYFQKVDIKELEIRQNAQQPLFTNQERAEIMSSPLAKKLERIQTKLLREHDPTLAVHLENLGIAPQVYGIRWIRLLFGREFPLDGLLVVWDAIFAYSPSLSLVDYLCVAMLQFIRDILIGHDYPTCMQQLMRFPIVGDTHYLIEKALHLRNPKIYPEPLSWQYQMTETGDGSLLEPLPRAGRLGRVGKTITSKAKAGARHLIPKRSSGHYEADQDQTSVSKSRSPRKPFGKGNKKVSGNSTEDYWSRKSPGIAVADEQAAAGRRPSSPVDYSGLQKELDNKETLCLYCGNKMDSFIDQLQDDLLQLSLPRQQEDSIFVSLAGLKQVRDLLKGTLKLSGTVPEMEIESLTRRSPQRNNNSNPFGVTPEPTDDIIDRSEPVELSSDPFCADTTNSDKASNEQSDVSGQISRQSPAVSKENSPAVEDDRFVVV